MSAVTLEFLQRLKNATWAKGAELLEEAKSLNLDHAVLSTGLETEKKQVIEALTVLLCGTESEVAIENIIKMMIAQEGTTNAGRGATALHYIGAKALPVIKKYLPTVKSATKIHLIHAIAHSKSTDLLGDLEAIAKNDRGAKIRETASQAISYLKGNLPLAECPLLPGLDGSSQQARPVRELNIPTTAPGLSDAAKLKIRDMLTTTRFRRYSVMSELVDQLVAGSEVKNIPGLDGLCLYFSGPAEIFHTVMDNGEIHFFSIGEEGDGELLNRLQSSIAVRLVDSKTIEFCLAFLESDGHKFLTIPFVFSLEDDAKSSMRWELRVLLESTSIQLTMLGKTAVGALVCLGNIEVPVGEDTKEEIYRLVIQSLELGSL